MKRSRDFDRDSSEDYSRERAAPTKMRIVGTAFDDEDDSKFVPIWKQEVRDEKGRKRLHGAFTGGFSAGYFNTVGSKEGFTPQSFRSSRTAKAEKREQKVEDFMDEEDLLEAGLSGPATIITTADFSAPTSAEKQQALLAATPFVPTAELVSTATATVKPCADSIGYRLLRLMGWREGEQFGEPRRRTAANAAAPRKVYGVQCDPATVLSPKGSHPPPAPVLSYSPKNNYYGLGYDPHHHAPEFAERRAAAGPLPAGPQRLRMADAVRRGGRGAESRGFGLGMFEDEDEDAVDMYGEDDMSKYDIAATRQAGVDKVDHGDKRRTAAVSKPDSAKPPLRRLCSDGTPPLRGFRLAERPEPPDPSFPVPKVPDDFVPYHIFPEDRPGIATTTSPAAHRETTTIPRDRTRAVGEPEPKGSTRSTTGGSVFDLLAPEDRQRLMLVKFQSAGKQTIGSDATAEPSGPPPAIKSVTDDKPDDAKLLIVNPNLPFADDPAKQARYRNFLLRESGQPPIPLKPWMDSLTEWERTQEVLEFSRISSQFRNVPELMSERFTPASSDARRQESAAIKERAAAPNAAAPVSTRVDTTALEAAKMKMFGRLTRTEQDWAPANLLCKRFNVRNPYPQGHAGKQGTQPAKPKELLADFVIPQIAAPTMVAAQQKQSVSGTQTTTAIQPSRPPLLPEQGEEPKRPPIDLFKAIFESDDDDASITSMQATASTPEDADRKRKREEEVDDALQSQQKRTKFS